MAARERDWKELDSAMISAELMMRIGKEELPEQALGLAAEDLSQLVDWLSEKDDRLRYQAFLLLEQRSLQTPDVYPFWNAFHQKLGSSNSYQRSIGLMLIAANAQWDEDRLLDQMIGEYLLLLYDEKPITVRQCLQSLPRIVACKPHLSQIVGSSVMAIDLAACRETMRKSILTDIVAVLASIRKQQTSDQIEAFLAEALAGDILDKKAKRQVAQLLGEPRMEERPEARQAEPR